MQTPLARLLVLLDYDGTITAHETNELAFQDLVGDPWQELEEALHRGLISHAECFRRQMAMVPGSRAQIFERAVQVAELSSGFPTFLRELAHGGARVAVVSTGFREAIETVWRQHSLPPVQLFASELDGDGPPYELHLNEALGDCPICGPGACKGALVRALRRPGDVVAVFGDSHADLCMAREADAVFARGTLARLCKGANLPWQLLTDYGAALKRLRELLAAAQTEGGSL
jgi:HAD superfamily phosphoserine phosphatase-like hydrolase